MDNISPEERLFRAIETKDSQDAEKTAKFEEPQKKDILLNIVDKVEAIFKTGFAGKAYNFKNFVSTIELRIVNRMLIFFLGAVIIFFMVDFFRLSPNIDKIYAGISSLPAPEIKRSRVTLLNPVSIYQKGASKRDIFNPVTSKVMEIQIEGTPLLAELVKDLSLVGIYWGEEPEVMIEDTQENKTYFLKIGQRIRGIKIQAIFEDRIILEYNSQTMEFM